MAKKNNSHHRKNRGKEHAPNNSNQSTLRKELVFNPGVELSTNANILRKELIKHSSDNRLILATSSLLAASAIAFFAGEHGTKEVSSANAYETRQQLAAEAVWQYVMNKPSTQTLVAAGIVTQQEDREMTNLARGRMMNQLERRKHDVEQRFQNALLELADRSEGPIAKALALIPQSEQEKIASIAGKLVADHALYVQNLRKRYEHQYIAQNPSPRETAERLSMSMVFLEPSRFIPLTITAHGVDFQLTQPRLIRGGEERVVLIHVPVENPDTIFVAGPGILGAGALPQFTQFPHAVFSDKSIFIASLIQELARGERKRVGNNLNDADIIATSTGMTDAVTALGSHTNVFLMSMVHSASFVEVHETFQQAAKKLPDGAVIVMMLPNRVRSGETSRDQFIAEANQAGFIQTVIAVDTIPQDSYTYSFPNVVPGEEDPFREVTVIAFKQERSDPTQMRRGK